MTSASGLSYENRIKARDLTVLAAYQGLHHADEMHYSQTGDRFGAIREKQRASAGKFPHYTDCSGFATWCIWNGHEHFGVRDNVSEANWAWGNTSSMIVHGKRVYSVSLALRGDLVFYGDPNGRSGHVAVYVGKINGVHKVISFGSERGPFLLPYNYREVTQIRRYI